MSIEKLKTILFVHVIAWLAITTMIILINNEQYEVLLAILATLVMFITISFIIFAVRLYLKVRGDDNDE